MVEVRIHGRGGQGVVTASDLLAFAAFEDGHSAQAFPSFGSERTGAPVVSYCRIRDTEIRTREPVLEPDLIIVQDPTLLAIMDVFSGLKPDGYALINSTKSIDELDLTELVESHLPGHIHVIPATDLAFQYVGRNVPNAVLLGAVTAFTDIVSMEAVEKAIRSKFPTPLAEKNIAAAQAAAELRSNEEVNASA